jgi:hypothetical protein
MVKLAILKSVPFEKKNDIKELDNEKIKKNIDGKIEFREFNNTLDLLYINQEIFGASSYIESSNCYYDSDILIQSYSVDNENTNIHENIVLIKREIIDNDTYNITPRNYNPENIDTDIFKYKDIDITDIINIIKQKSIINCVYIDCNNNINDEKILMLNNNEDVGKIILTNKNKEITYINIANITNKNHKETPEKNEETIKEKMNAYCTEYMYAQFDIGLCILNCYCKSFSNKKNKILSDIVQQEIYGDVVVYLQSKLNDDTESILNSDSKLFNKIINISLNKTKIKRNNPYFFNIYKELH